MKVKTLIQELREAVASGAFSEDSEIQIDIGDETHWEMSVDVSAVSEPRVIILNIGE